VKICEHPDLEKFLLKAKIWIERGATERKRLIVVIFPEGLKFSAMMPKGKFYSKWAS
jgi:hypothetical protein